MSGAHSRARSAAVVLLVGLAVLPAAVAGARGSARAPAPALGDWEGTAAGGVPLSFALARGRHGVEVTALAVGFAAGCPIGSRHTLAAPLDRPRFAAAAAPAVAGSIVLSGFTGSRPLEVAGVLRSPRSATLSTTDVNQGLPCPWPKTVTWAARAAHRMAVPDATWRATVSGPGLGGTVTVRTGARGRVVTSFQARYTCLDSDGNSGTGALGSTPAYEFVNPSGTFASLPETPIAGKVAVAWSAAFGSRGTLRGSFTDASPCTGKAVHVTFAAARPAAR